MKIVKNLILYALLLIVFVATIFPIIYTFSASLMSNVEIMTDASSIFPKNPTFENYVTVWTSPDFNAGRLFFNSTYYTLIVVFATILTSTMAGYVFARSEFPGKKLIFGVFTALMFINLGSATIVPMLEIVRMLNLQNGLWGLIVVRIFSVSITNIYLVKGYVISLPRELDEAAEIDGCNFLEIFFRIIAPLLKPIVATLAILAFQGSWNEYLMPTVFTLGDPKQRTLIAGIVALKSSSGAASQWNLMFAGSAISIAPVLVVYLFANKYFVSGLSSGAVKG